MLVDGTLVERYTWEKARSWFNLPRGTINQPGTCVTHQPTSSYHFGGLFSVACSQYPSSRSK